MPQSQPFEDSSLSNSDIQQSNSILSSSSSSSDQINANHMTAKNSEPTTPKLETTHPVINVDELPTSTEFSTPGKNAHFRTLSIPKNSPTHKSITSPGVTSSTPSSQVGKKGINLGLNILGNSAGRPRSVSKRLMSVEHEEGSPTSSRTPIINEADTSMKSEKDSQTTDIYDQSVLKTPENSKHSFQIDNDTTPTISGTESHDTTIAEEDTSNDLSEQLRLLASKEMEILEVKEHIKTLEKRKGELEVDLHTLKSNIQRSMMMHVSTAPTRQPVRSPISVAKRNLNKISIGSGAVPDPLLDYGYAMNSQNSSPEQPKTESSLYSSQENKSSWSNTLFSKPLNFIQQIDTRLQQEIEKLHIGLLNDDEMSAAQSDIKRNDSDESFDNIDAKEINDPIKSMANESSSHDVIDTVSNHLWAFVKEVRSNMKHSEQQQQQNQGHLKLSPKKSPIRQRIPSFSGRQTYGHYSAKSKKKSDTLESNEESEPYANVDTAGEEVSSVILDITDDVSDGFTKTVEMKVLDKPQDIEGDTTKSPSLS